MLVNHRNADKYQCNMDTCTLYQSSYLPYIRNNTSILTSNCNSCILHSAITHNRKQHICSRKPNSEKLSHATSNVSSGAVGSMDLFGPQYKGYNLGPFLCLTQKSLNSLHLHSHKPNNN